MFEPKATASHLDSTLFGHAAISELSLLSGVKRKLDFEPAEGSFWRKAVIGRDSGFGRVPLQTCGALQSLDQYGRGFRQTGVGREGGRSLKDAK
jgi:hypothetical protein